ncbi:MAG: elongation factor G [Chitinophagales bacterium]|nr:elongation factor G [Chitinophagales bacterium]HAE14497.1 elongation factor G [Bacteroidota bacterium]MCB9020258.1 elongation factor G [Chitinophagales bacterium]MCB9020503.1 elongation factor G [Chitinophagales bacterium]MCB9031548.1 elongation factor G [Chitinophagales bacterium]
MKSHDSTHIKNVVLVGHSGSGKTTLAECMLFEAGVINRRGTIAEKNTIGDYSDIEHERGNSIFSHIMHVDWKDTKINIIDTPGMDDFVGEVISSFKVADTGIMVINAANGVEVGTEIIWEYADHLKKPMLFVANHLDEEKSDFDAMVEQAKDRFGRKVTVVQYPYNQGVDFNAVIDVLNMVMYRFGADGGKPEKLDIPAEEMDKAKQLHNDLIEAIAENDETLMERYFEKGTLDETDMQKGLLISIRDHELFPMFCISAKHNMGSGRIMGFIDYCCPSAAHMNPEKLTNGADLPCNSSNPPVAFVFKTMSEPHLGDMSFFKVCSGKLKVGDDLVNTANGQTERLSQIYLVQGKKREPVEEVLAGDIAATVKLKKTHTNNTLSAKGQNVEVVPIHYPEPKVQAAIHVHNKGDEEKMGMALNHIHEEDPTITIDHNMELKQTIINAQGEMHLAMLKWKIEHLYGIQFDYEKTRIPYRETIQKSVRSDYRHKKQSGGAGQFAEVHMLVEPWYEGMPDPPDLNVRGREEHPLKWGGKLVYYNCIVGGSIDARFLPSILKGVMDKMENGPLTGSYVRDVRVSVYDGKMHPVDSNDMAFKLAGMMAFRNAFREADPKILEPVYDLEIMVPADMMGDVMGDLQTRRGIVMGMDSDGHYQKIKARVPLSELHDYSSTLRSFTQGRGKFTRQFAEYAPVPFDLQQKLIEAHQEELAEA